MPIPKIMGSETELGITTRDPACLEPVESSILLINALSDLPAPQALWDYAGENPFSDARGFEAMGERERPSQQDNRALNTLLPNGGRWYVDGAHPEYSTPETATARDLTLYEKAGERLADRCREVVNRSLPPHRQLLLFKNNSDGKGNSYGYHENYLVERRVSFATLVEQLTPFLVSRILLCGAGKVGAENGGKPCAYQISQRADFFESLIGLDTMGKRAIINTRDEPHADEERFRRLHVIVGDSNLAEVATYLKVGTTAAVLTAIEAGALRTDCALEDPVRALKEISHDPTCTARVRLRRGGEWTAGELQRAYLEAAAAVYATTAPPPEVADILARWDRILTQLAVEPLGCARELDWAIKWALLEAYREKRGLALDDPRIGALDLQYHDLRPEKGLYYRLERDGYVDRLLTDTEIARAQTVPPPDTRAYFRGRCIQRFPAAVYAASWSSLLLDVGHDTVKRIPMPDPTRGTATLVGGILERSADAAELVERLTGC
jgi:proteasome accessory factor A